MAGFIGPRGGDLSTFDRRAERRARRYEFDTSLLLDENRRLEEARHNRKLLEDRNRRLDADALREQAMEERRFAEQQRQFDTGVGLEREQREYRAGRDTVTDKRAADQAQQAQVERLQNFRREVAALGGTLTGQETEEELIAMIPILRERNAGTAEQREAARRKEAEDAAIKRFAIENGIEIPEGEDAGSVVGRSMAERRASDERRVQEDRERRLAQENEAEGQRFVANIVAQLDARLAQINSLFQQRVALDPMVEQELRSEASWIAQAKADALTKGNIQLAEEILKTTSPAADPALLDPERVRVSLADRRGMLDDYLKASELPEGVGQKAWDFLHPQHPDSAVREAADLLGPIQRNPDGTTDAISMVQRMLGLSLEDQMKVANGLKIATDAAKVSGRPVGKDFATQLAGTLTTPAGGGTGGAATPAGGMDAIAALPADIQAAAAAAEDVIQRYVATNPDAAPFSGIFGRGETFADLPDIAVGVRNAAQKYNELAAKPSPTSFERDLMAALADFIPKARPFLGEAPGGSGQWDISNTSYMPRPRESWWTETTPEMRAFERSALALKALGFSVD